ncbi:MAG: hypothetical protein ACP5OG_02070 [Candidatus Nanoarchaeia archaeon]
MFFLESLTMDPNALASGAMAGGLVAFIMAMLGVFIVIGIAIYLFTSFAFMSIAKKARYSSPGLAWIPIVGPAIIASSVAKMHWWPILFLIGFWIPGIGGLFSLAFTVFFIIWMWKTFEAIKKPGWWAIMLLIPIVSIVFLAIAAWSKN